MKLATTIDLHCKFYVQDIKYGLVVSEHDTEEEAKKAAEGRPYSRVTTNPRLNDQRKGD